LQYLQLVVNAPPVGGGVAVTEAGGADCAAGGCISYGRLSHSVTILIQPCSKIHTITAVF
jgi:hypothetical protein